MAVSLTTPLQDRTGAEIVRTPIIDTDVHVYIQPDDLERHLSPFWRDHYLNFGKRTYDGMLFPRSMPMAARHDAWPPNGDLPGANLEFTQMQLLDEFDMDYAVLTPLTGTGEVLNFDFGLAHAQAVNDYQIEDWCAHDSRMRASIIIPYEDGPLSAEEIHRMGNHPSMAQVFLVTRTRDPLGSRRYWPIYEAACEYDLPIAVHFGGVGGSGITGAGSPTYYIEDHAGMAQSFQSQVTSIVSQGLFEIFDNLKFVLIEGGFAWMIPLMWRLDRTWEKLHKELPRVKKPPSEYIREHMWISTQPIEEPLYPHQFNQMLDQLDMTDRLMFASDYPHWDFDNPMRAIPSTVADAARRRIMAENASELYDLPI